MTRCLQRLSLLLLTSALAGCSASDGAAGGPAVDPGGPSDVVGGQTGEETAGCLPVRSEALARSASSPLGFSADDLLAMIGSERQVPLTWDDGTTTSLLLALSYAGGDATFSEREYRANPSGEELVSTRPLPELASLCNDVLSVPATLGFATADGAFAETWAVILSAETLNAANVFHELDTSALVGTFRVTQVDAAAFAEVSVFATLNFVQGAWTGSLSGQATTTAGPGSEGAVSAQMFPVATF